MNTGLNKEKQINPWIIAIAVMFPTSIQVLDSTVANVALPYIAGGLAASVDECTWVLTSYIISNAIMLPITYWFSDKLGKKNFLLYSIVVFTLSSIMCGFSTNLPEMIIFRIIQGFGGGGLIPMAQSILFDVFPKEKHGKAMGFYGFGMLLAPIIGPFVGGWLSDNYNWNWIFFINIPMGIIAYIMIKSIIPENYNDNKKEKLGIDVIGLSLLVLFIAPFQIVLDKGQENDWFSSDIIVFFTITACISFAVLIVWLLNVKEPLIKLKVFKNRNYSIAVVLIFIRSLAFYGFGLSMPLFLEKMLGYTATIAGEVSIFSGLAVLIAMPVAGSLTSKYNPKYLMLFGVSLCVFSLSRFIGFTLDVNFATFALYRTFFGVGSAFLIVPINTVAFSTVPKELNAQYAGILSLANSLGSSIGISLTSTMLVRRSQFHQNYLIENANNLNHVFVNYVNLLQNHMHTVGKSAYQIAYNVIQQQSQYQAYIDVYQILLFFLIIFTPCIFILRRPLDKVRT